MFLQLFLQGLLQASNPTLVSDRTHQSLESLLCLSLQLGRVKCLYKLPIFSISFNLYLLFPLGSARLFSEFPLLKSLCLLSPLLMLLSSQGYILVFIILHRRYDELILFFPLLSLCFLMFSFNIMFNGDRGIFDIFRETFELGGLPSLVLYLLINLMLSDALIARRLPLLSHL